MTRVMIVVAGLAGGLGVALGAWLAHGAVGVLDDQAFAWAETALRYQMWHALALLGVAAVHLRFGGRLLAAAGLAFLAGLLLFCGSLYLLAFLGAAWVTPVTPVGGVSFILGWLLVAVAGFRAAR